MKDEKYICEIKLSRPVDKNSYLAKLPAVKYLAEKGEASPLRTSSPPP